MRALCLALCLATGTTALAADEPYGWAHCTAPEAGLSVTRCVAHVMADCDASPDPASCLMTHREEWFRYDANATLGDAAAPDASGRLSLKALTDAIGRATPDRSACAETDAECLLREAIKRALGNHALRVAGE